MVSTCILLSVVLSDLIDDMAEKLQESLGVEEFSSLCNPTQVQPYTYRIDLRITVCVFSLSFP